MTIITTPVDRNTVVQLQAGDTVRISGDILVFRDQVHKLLNEMIARGEELPFSLRDEVLYYCGPTPARHGRPVGSAGPTTSSRMDKFTGPLLEQGVAITIGKGDRSLETVELLKRHRAVYLVAIGGAGALIARHIVATEVIAFPELGTEAARRFTVKDMPAIVGIDSRGVSAFVDVTAVSGDFNAEKNACM